MDAGDSTGKYLHPTKAVDGYNYLHKKGSRGRDGLNWNQTSLAVTHCMCELKHDLICYSQAVLISKMG